MTFKIQKINLHDREEIAEIVKNFWGDRTIVAHGELFYPEKLDGIKAIKGNDVIGFLHYQVRGEDCEILTLISLQEGEGIGSALFAKVEAIARENHCLKLSLITTNDNLHALGFYQRRGFHLAALYPNQIAVSRELKPAIPEIGDNAIPLRDELLLEKALD